MAGGYLTPPSIFSFLRLLGCSAPSTPNTDVYPRPPDQPGDDGSVVRPLVTSGPGSSSGLTAVVKVLGATVHQEVRAALSLAPDTGGTPGTDGTLSAHSQVPVSPGGLHILTFVLPGAIKRQVLYDRKKLLCLVHHGSCSPPHNM